MDYSENDIYTPIINRIMLVEDITWGDPKQGLIVRYRGRIYNEDTASTFDNLYETLRPMEITPLFREESGQHIVLLMRGIIKPKPSAAWVNVLLFGLTVITVLMAGAIYSFDYSGPMPDSSPRMRKA